ncbi:GNAT family N-acetyltransferase [Thermoleophilia bacterium SCSIO 60948]|nr:GNAT family N-acetyltransferase [Thermoleophilia bacterium SCSIO 60948]
MAGAGPPSRFRVAVAAEAARIGEIGRAAYGGYEREIGIRPGPLDEDYDARVAEGVVWISDAEPGAAIGGFVILERRSDHLWIDNVAVDPSAQHHGLGRALLAFAESRASALGLGELRLLTHERMRRNIEIYRRLGFEDDPAVGVDELGRQHMRKRLV